MNRTFLTVTKNAVFTQEQDCCGPSDNAEQELIVDTHDGGGGTYVTLTTSRWALDPNDENEVAAFIIALRDLVKGCGDQQ